MREVVVGPIVLQHGVYIRSLFCSVAPFEGEGHGGLDAAPGDQGPEVFEFAVEQAGAGGGRGAAAEAEAGDDAAAQRAEQGGEGGVFGFGVLPDGVVGVGEAGSLGGETDGVAKGAGGVGQAVFGGLEACPDASAGEGVDGVEAEAAPFGDDLQEAVVDAVDAVLDIEAFGGAEGTEGVAHVGAGGGADAVGGDAEVAGGAFLEVHDQTEDADGAGQGGGGGEDVVGGAAHVVAAGGGVVAHGDDDGFFGLAELADFAPDDFGGEGAAAGAVDAQDDGVDVGIAANFAEGLGEGVADDLFVRVAGVDDVAGGVDDGDSVIGVGIAEEVGGGGGGVAVVVGEGDEAGVV